MCARARSTSSILCQAQTTIPFYISNVLLSPTRKTGIYLGAAISHSENKLSPQQQQQSGIPYYRRILFPKTLSCLANYKPNYLQSNLHLWSYATLFSKLLVANWFSFQSGNPWGLGMASEASHPGNVGNFKISSEMFLMLLKNHNCRLADAPQMFKS